MNHTAECDKELFREKRGEAGRQESRRCVSGRETVRENSAGARISLISSSSRSFPDHCVDLFLGAKITKQSLEFG